MKLLLLLLAVMAAVLATSDGLTDAVTWDPYSLIVNGERVYIFSGEFHYERLPVPALWRDVLEKFKANGLNAVSIYFFWSYHSARRDVFDFESPGKDVQNLLDIAKEVGIYVIARPGPYCNAETNGGGLALWGSDGSMGALRTSDETYHQAWLPWITEISSILEKNQLSNGGNVILDQIENELQETRHDPTNTVVVYMEQIENATREAGIVIPFSSNEKGERSESWSTDYENVGGAVNVYGLDSYPGGLSCFNNNTGFNVVRNYYQWFQNYSYTQPEYLPEFEAGWIEGWGAAFFDQCYTEHTPAFADVYYKNNVGQRVTLMNLYMGYGGTNWGNLGAPVVYTSYDYSAPLRETRQVETKFKQTKLLALFTRVSQDLLGTVMESNGTGNAVSSQDIWSWVLRNPNTTTGFYTVQQSHTPSNAVVNFTAYLTTSAGEVSVPSVSLNGRQSKILTTDYHFGDHTLLYSSADILTYGVFDDATVLVMYAEVGQVSEFAFKTTASPNFKQYGDASVSSHDLQFNGSSSDKYTKYTYTQTQGSTVLRFHDNVIVYLLDTETAWNFFAPPTTNNPRIAANEQVFVLGPYNVRNVSVADKSIYLIGDNDVTSSIEVYAGKSVKDIFWNGQQLKTYRTSYRSLTATVPGAEDRTTDLPELSWVVANSLPEASRDFDDSNWVVCSNTTTLSPVAPLSLPVLFSSDYGYYPGIKIYRGYFDGTSATAANITVQGGAASGWTAWLNGQYVGGNTGSASLWGSTELLDLSNAKKYNSRNVLTVVTDYTGHDETSRGPAGVENPRGILGATLLGSNNTKLNFTQWKIAGNAGGNANIDSVRGPLNEGGLYGERLGWHLPGFDSNGPEWSSGSPLDGLNKSGINWYISHFNLSIPSDMDVPIGIQLNAPEGTNASVVLFINGYQYGKFIPQIGPQTRFPFQPGVLNNNGENTLSLALWAETDAGAKLSDASLFAYGKYLTGFNFNQDWTELQPGWTSERLKYA